MTVILTITAEKTLSDERKTFQQTWIYWKCCSELWSDGMQIIRLYWHFRGVCFFCCQFSSTCSTLCWNTCTSSPARCTWHHISVGSSLYNECLRALYCITFIVVGQVMQSASLIAGLSTAVGTAALLGMKFASTGHLKSLYFSCISSYLISWKSPEGLTSRFQASLACSDSICWHTIEVLY